MTHHTGYKCALAIVFLLLLAAPASAQSGPTPEELEFVKVLGGGVRAASEAEVAAKKAELPPLITREKQLKDNAIQLERQIAQLNGRIETLSPVAANCPAMRAYVVQAQSQANQQSKDQLAELKKTYDALNVARERRLEAEKAVARQQGTSSQLLSDFEHLYKLSRMDAPQYSWQAMMDRLTDVARRQQLKSKITIRLVL
jgi:membrane-bound lytic murein transglycosylase